MLHFSFVSNATRNTRGVPGSTDDSAVRSISQLSTRSLLLSALLGTHPPALPNTALVAFVELFGRTPGAARTALSRMAGNGDIQSENGWSHLGERLVERQRQQDSGRRVPVETWGGSWVTVVALKGNRSMARRRAFRSQMTARRFGELRPDIWLRPEFGAESPEQGDLLVSVGPLSSPDQQLLVDRLWPLSDLQRQASALHADLERQLPAISAGRVGSVPAGFVTSAQVVRFLRLDPLLPPELQPPDWMSDQLRATYDSFEKELQGVLRTFFAEAVDKMEPPAAGRQARTVTADQRS